jgi:hypothetical protein
VVARAGIGDDHLRGGRGITRANVVVFPEVHQPRIHGRNDRICRTIGIKTRNRRSDIPSNGHENRIELEPRFARIFPFGRTHGIGPLASRKNAKTCGSTLNTLILR